MAGSEGFEPSMSVNPYSLSRGAPSATRPTARQVCIDFYTPENKGFWKVNLEKNKRKKALRIPWTCHYRPPKREGLKGGFFIFCTVEEKKHESTYRLWNQHQLRHLYISREKGASILVQRLSDALFASHQVKKNSIQRHQHLIYFSAITLSNTNLCFTTYLLVFIVFIKQTLVGWSLLKLLKKFTAELIKQLTLSFFIYIGRYFF